MASALAVYASQRQLPERHATFASGCWLDFAGWLNHWAAMKRLPMTLQMTARSSEAN